MNQYTLNRYLLIVSIILGISGICGGIASIFLKHQIDKLQNQLKCLELDMVYLRDDVCQVKGLDTSLYVGHMSLGPGETKVTREIRPTVTDPVATHKGEVVDPRVYQSCLLQQHLDVDAKVYDAECVLVKINE